jgi:hypothetical protein
MNGRILDGQVEQRREINYNLLLFKTFIEERKSVKKKNRIV